MAETDPDAADVPVLVEPAPPQEPARLSALARYAIAIVAGILVGVLASYLLRKIGF